MGVWAYLQLFCYGDFLARAEHQQQRIVEISPKRAEVLDRNLHTLAMSALVDSCFAIPSEIADAQMVGRLLGPVLKVTPEEIETRLASSSSLSCVGCVRKLPPDTAARIAALDLKGRLLSRKEDESLLSQTASFSPPPLLGYVDIDEKGLGGIEYSLEDRIRSQPGRMLIFTDARRRWYDGSDAKPDTSSSVVLTIDENIQFIAEKELAAAIQQTHAPAGSVVVRKTRRTARFWPWPIRPTFNPNAIADSPAEARMNRAVSALYEPGSVFKVVTLSAAIDQGLTTPDEVVDCEMGAIYIGNHRIRDHHPFGNLTVAEILARSSVDVGAIKIGMRVGAPKLYDYIRAYGFGSPSGIELPGESRGLLRRLENWTPISIGAIAPWDRKSASVAGAVDFCAMSAIANGGLLYKPQVVLGLRPQVQPLAPPPAANRVIREGTAAAMRQMLEGVVLHGTGQLARLDGHSSAGKTGTAQKLDPGTGRYSRTQLIASFVGFAPVNNPAVTILVQAGFAGRAARRRCFGGGSRFSNASPSEVLAYLNVPQDIPLPPKQLRSKRNAPAAVGLSDLADFSPSATDSLEAPAPAPPTNPVVAYSDCGPGGRRRHRGPWFRGKDGARSHRSLPALGHESRSRGHRRRDGAEAEARGGYGRSAWRQRDRSFRPLPVLPPSSAEARSSRAARRRLGSVGIGG